MKATNTIRRLKAASRKLIKAYASTNTSLQYVIDAEEAFLAAERKHTKKPASAMLHHRAEAYLSL